MPTPSRHAALAALAAEQMAVDRYFWKNGWYWRLNAAHQWDKCIGRPAFFEDHEYKYDPPPCKPYKIGDTVLEERPLSEEPEEGAKVWTFSLDGDVYWFAWLKWDSHLERLSNNAVFATQSGAEAARDAVLKILRGE